MTDALNGSLINLSEQFPDAIPKWERAGVKTSSPMASIHLLLFSSEQISIQRAILDRLQNVLGADRS